MKEVLAEHHSSRERSLGRWWDKVKEYMCERGATRERGEGLEQGGSAWCFRINTGSISTDLICQAVRKDVSEIKNKILVPYLKKKHN